MGYFIRQRHYLRGRQSQGLTDSTDRTHVSQIHRDDCVQNTCTRHEYDNSKMQEMIIFHIETGSFSSNFPRCTISRIYTTNKIVGSWTPCGLLNIKMMGPIGFL